MRRAQAWLRTEDYIDTMLIGEVNRCLGWKKSMSLAFWRDLSVIWLSLFCFIALVIPLVALYFAVRGMNALQRKVTPLVELAQKYSRIVRMETEKISNKVVEPIIQINGRYTKTITWLQSLWANGK